MFNEEVHKHNKDFWEETLKNFVNTSLGEVSIDSDCKLDIEAHFLGNPQDSSYTEVVFLELETLDNFMDDLALSKLGMTELITFLSDIRDRMA